MFSGQTHSFDAMLYARALWGVAHGDLFNPVIGLPTFSVHAHLLLLPLAPLAWLMPAAGVLVLAQAVALGATFWLVARGFADAAGERPGAAAVALWGGAVAVIATPLVLNPFLFDARPDLLGVPLLAAGLLRGVRRGGLDRRALALMAAGALAREELALAVASGAALAPAGPPGSVSRRGRWLVAVAAAGYFFAYYLAVRPRLGGDDGSSLASVHRQIVLTGAGLGEAAPALDVVVRHKLELLLVAAASAGGLVWLGWRWLGAALPGFAILAISRWMVERQLNIHYGMFVAPALLAAAVAGYRRWREQGAPRPVAFHVAVSALALLSYLFGSSAPGGRLFAANLFDLAREDGGLRWDLSHGRLVASVHARLRSIPPAAGVAAPWPYAAPIADRPVIWSDVRLRRELAEHGQVPPEIADVALRARELPELGRVLAGRHGFRLAGFDFRPVEVLTRDPAEVAIPWDRIGRRLAPGECAAPLARWPALGLALCAVAGGNGAEATATFARVAAPPAGAAVVPLQVELVPTGDPGAPAVGLWLFEGVVNLADLPADTRVVLRSDRALAASPGRVVLRVADGREIPPE